MLDFFRNLLTELWNVILSIRFIDILDMLLLTYLIYIVLKMVKETRAGQLLKGIALLVCAYILSDVMGLKAMRLITQSVLSIGLLALVILFQPELRRALEKFGQSTFHLKNLTSLGHSNEIIERWETAIPIICESAAELSRTYTGALIVIERSTKLGEHISNGTILNAVPSLQLFGTIFFPKTPLHDGAVIMRDGIVWAAACFLPNPQKEERVEKHLGSRHRAAIGMSENSDALVIVVSEETGQISVACDGELTRNFTAETLEKLLRDTLIPEKSDSSLTTLFTNLKKPVKTTEKTKSENKKPSAAKKKEGKS